MTDRPGWIPPDPTGDLEALLTMMTGVGSQLPAGLGGALTLLGSQDASQAADTVRKITEDLTYTPRTKGGLESLQSVAEHPAIKFLGEAQTKMGDLGFDLAGPIGGVFGEMAPDLIDMVIGSHGAGMVDNALIGGMRAVRAPMHTIPKFHQMRLKAMKTRLDSPALGTPGTPSETAMWKETGWYRHPGDYRARWEIDDSKFNVGPTDRNIIDRLVEEHNDPNLEHSSYKLKDIVQHPEFAKNYPTLWDDLSIRVDPSQGTGAEYNQFKKEILVGPEGNVETSILHEMQHAIQDLEDFSKGGNTRQFLEHYRTLGYDETEAGMLAFEDYLNLVGETEARMVEGRFTARKAGTPMHDNPLNYQKYDMARPPRTQSATSDGPSQLITDIFGQ